MQMRPLAIFAALLTTCILVGCRPYEGSCSWLQPADGSEIATTGPRKPIASECSCIGCSAPGEFRLERKTYTVEMWNGDRWYAEFVLRARAPDGSKLILRSPQLTSLEGAGPLFGRWKEFEYFLPTGFSEPAGPRSIRVEVLSPTGEVLGKESIQLDLVVRKDYKIEFI